MSRHQQPGRGSGKPDDHVGPVSRRDFLRLSGCAVAAGLAYWTLRPKPVAAGVLPPGALTDADFRAACLRCGRCTAVCDQSAIQIDVHGRPYLDGISGWCDFCMLCGEVCPSGALTPVDPEGVKLATAVINQDRCLAWSIRGACQICFRECNNLQQAIWIDDDRQPHVNADLCNGCGACVFACPRSAHEGLDRKHGKAVALQQTVRESAPSNDA